MLNYKRLPAIVKTASLDLMKPFLFLLISGHQFITSNNGHPAKKFV